MDRLTLTSSILFVIADIFAVISVSLPEWIVSEVGDFCGRVMTLNNIFLQIQRDTKLGLMRECITIYNRPQICIAPTLPTEWAVTLLCIFVGCIAITTTVILLIVSYWERSVITHARWIGFLAMVLFCFAAVVFPIGFHIPQIGGEPYQLPNSHQVGVSYIFFVLALWITVISELFVGKVCLPHL